MENMQDELVNNRHNISIHRYLQISVRYKDQMIYLSVCMGTMRRAAV